MIYEQPLIRVTALKVCKNILKFTLGSGHVTFWNLIGRDEAGLSTNQLGDRLRATEGCFMMTDIADVESVVETAVAGKVISSCHWGNLLVNKHNGIYRQSLIFFIDI